MLYLIEISELRGVSFFVNANGVVFLFYYSYFREFVPAAICCTRVFGTSTVNCLYPSWSKFDFLDGVLNRCSVVDVPDPVC